MKIEGPGKMLRIYIGDADHWQGKSLAQAILERAKLEGLAGATVVHGAAGFGANSRIHTASILRLSEDLPVQIEIVDVAERITPFLTILDEMVTEGMITVHDCQIVKYVHAPKNR